MKTENKPTIRPKAQVDELVIYLSGPMTGIADYNHPEFCRIARELRDKGYKVISPDETVVHLKNWENYMRADIKLLMDADKVAVLEGWQQSKGAQIEVFLASQLGMEVIDVNYLLKG